MRRGVAEVLAGWHAQGASEHGAEGAGAVVAEIQRYLDDRVPGGQRIEAGQQAGPLQPLAEAQPGFALELPGQGASADTQPLGAARQARGVRRAAAAGPAQPGTARGDR